MIPFKIKFILDEKTREHIYFESNEKPFKGDVFTIQEGNGKVSEVRLKEVNKVLIRGDETFAALEYHCLVERHDAKGVAIGFK